MNIGGLQVAFDAEVEYERLLFAIQEELASVVDVHTNRCPPLRPLVLLLALKGYRLEVKVVPIKAANVPQKEGP